MACLCSNAALRDRMYHAKHVLRFNIDLKQWYILLIVFFVFNIIGIILYEKNTLNGNIWKQSEAKTKQCRAKAKAKAKQIYNADANAKAKAKTKRKLKPTENKRQTNKPTNANNKQTNKQTNKHQAFSWARVLPMVLHVHSSFHFILVDHSCHL